MKPQDIVVRGDMLVEKPVGTEFRVTVMDDTPALICTGAHIDEHRQHERDACWWRRCALGTCGLLLLALGLVLYLYLWRAGGGAEARGDVDVGMEMRGPA